MIGPVEPMGLAEDLERFLEKIEVLQTNWSEVLWRLSQC